MFLCELLRILKLLHALKQVILESLLDIERLYFFFERDEYLNIKRDILRLCFKFFKKREEFIRVGGVYFPFFLLLSYFLFKLGENLCVLLLLLFNFLLQVLFDIHAADYSLERREQCRERRLIKRYFFAIFQCKRKINYAVAIVVHRKFFCVLDGSIGKAHCRECVRGGWNTREHSV